jgi:hypothetical protein
MKFIVTVHWNPGLPKAYAVEAPDAQIAIKMIRESIGHSYTMPAVAVPVDEAAYTRPCMTSQPTSQQLKKRELIKIYLQVLLEELK